MIFIAVQPFFGKRPLHTVFKQPFSTGLYYSTPAFILQE